MDFAKVFDKVPHKRLISKLKFYGISDQITNWITSFLANRTQTVHLENTTSEKIAVTSGVPQGTVLGPILFLIYINDLPDYIKHSQIRLFADNSIIYSPIKTQANCIKLQEDLESAVKWEQDWIMAFHPDKCNILRVTTKKSPQHFYYNMHGHILESVQSAKYLGVTLSADLKWNNNIQQMTSKANKSLSFIRRNLQINSKSVKDRAYQSLVRPKLEYCCSVWDPYTTENIYKIEQVQRRAARYACHRHHNTSIVTEMIHSFDWPTLQERRLKTRLHIFYKIINNKIAVPYDNILIPTYLLTLPFCTGVSRIRALSPAHTFSSHTISPPPTKNLLTFFSRHICLQSNNLFPSIVEMFRINFYRVSLDFSFRNMKLIVVYVIERITTPIRNVHSR